MNTPIVVTFILTRDEYARAMRLSMLRSKMILLVLGLLLYMGISPSITWILKHSENPAYAFPQSGLAYTVGCFTMIAYLIWILPMLAVRKIKAETRDQEQKFEFSEEGAATRIAGTKSTLDWNSGIKVRETGRFFFLYPGGKATHILPKRAFASTTDIDAFRELVTRKLKKT